MRSLVVALAFLFIAGCGDVQWFPDSTTNNSGSSGTPSTPSGSTTAPNAFSFAPVTIKSADASASGDVASESITITGNNSNGWALTAVDTPLTTQSELEVAGVWKARSPEGLGDITIKPGDTLVVHQKPSVIPGVTVTTKVTIGTLSAEFKTTTIAD